MTDKQEQLEESEIQEETAKADSDQEQDAVESAAEDQESTTEETTAGNPADALKDQLLRTMADFENFKKRKQKEFIELIQNANEKLIVDLLPVVDDLERALRASKELATEDPAVQNALKGFDFIHKKLMKVLESRGLKPMQSVGEVFNADLHDALMQIEKPDAEPDTVVDEHEKGYYLNDKVIRHAKVIVSK